MNPRLRVAIAAAPIVLACLTVLAPPPPVHAAAATSNPPTWRNDIAPVLYAHCTACHHTGGSAPFALLTYADALRWADAITSVTQSRYMPPWLPSGPHGVFAGDRRLADADLALLRRWSAAGAPEGAGAPPAAPVYVSGWQLGPPDLVLEMSSPVEVPATGQDLFLNFALPAALTSTRWVRAMEISPGSPTLVHHANVLLDRTASLRRIHPDTWRNGIPGMDLTVDSGLSFEPDSHFLFWKPDSTALVEPPGMPWRLDPGTDLILNLHLKPTGKPERVSARIALYFTPNPATEHPMLLQLEHDDALDIPPNDPAFLIHDSLTLPAAVDLLGIYPHAHYLGQRLEGWAILPGGARQTLILIPGWDIDRQSVYRYTHPIPLPAGTVVHMRYAYNNTSANPHNPSSPPIRVHAGNRSTDEMGHLWLQVLPHPQPAARNAPAPDPRIPLEQAWMRNRLARNPTDSVALYNLASIALMTGDPAQASLLFDQALARHPDDPRILISSASALASTGDWHSAQTRYRAALARDPGSSDALFDLAHLDLTHAGSDHATLPEAETLFRRLLALTPADPEAEQGLALTLAAAGDLAQAIPHLQAWQRLASTDPEPHRALAQVFASLHRLPEALTEQQQAIALSPGNASDWNDLGVLEARSGDRASARRDFTHALDLDPANAPARANLARL